MLRACLVAVTVVMLSPCAAATQEVPVSSTRMLLGGGVSFVDRGAATPTYLAGVEVQPSRSRLSFRVVTEYWEVDRFWARDDWYHGRGVGAQVVAVRPFGDWRARPYVMAGASVYSTSFGGVALGFAQSDSGYIRGTPETFSSRNIVPSLIWGGGLEARVNGVRVFGELRLPFYAARAFRAGGSSLAAFGVAF